MASKKKLKKRIEKIEKQIGQLPVRKTLSQEELDDIFYRYYFNYSEEKNIEIREKAVNLQKFVFDNINEQGLENTAVEKLLDMTLEDIECQHTIKSGIENKSGFVLALWGILISTLFDSDNNLLSNIKNILYDLDFDSNNFWIVCIAVILLGITGYKSLFYIYQTIKPHIYTKFRFEDKKVNFESAAENKGITYTVFMDNVTNSWEKNRKIINDMADNYHKSIKWIIAFAVSLILSFIFIV